MECRSRSRNRSTDIVHDDGELELWDSIDRMELLNLLRQLYPITAYNLSLKAFVRMDVLERDLERLRRDGRVWLNYKEEWEWLAL